MKSTIRLDARSKRLFGIAGCAVGLALVVRVLYVPIIGLIRSQHVALQDLRRKVADAHLLIDQLPKQEAEFAKAQSRSQELQMWRSSRESLARIMEALDGEAKHRRLECSIVQPRVDESEPRLLSLGTDKTLREVPLHVTLSGRYSQIGEFLGALANMPFLASVKTVTVTKSEAGSSRLQADLILAVYLAQAPSTGDGHR